MMINPVTSKIDLLRTMKPGDRVIWALEGGDVTRVQKQFSAAASQIGVSISQKAAIIVTSRADEMPAQCLIIEAQESLI